MKLIQSKYLLSFLGCVVSFFAHSQWQQTGTYILNTNPGFVGVGTFTSPPTALLDVKLDQNNVTNINVRNLSTGSSATARYDLTTNTPFSYALSSLHDNGGSPYYQFSVGSGVGTTYFDAPEFNFRNPAGTLIMKITKDGYVGINTDDTKQYQFAVNGSAVFTKVVVKPNAYWPDYVFKESYRLLPLDSLSKYVTANNHLPDIPSSDSVQRQGLDVGNTEAALLKKIEELTLYIIQQNKRLDAQQEQIDRLNRLSGAR
jgi:hypothetical protein